MKTARNIAGIVLLLCTFPWLALAQPAPEAPSPQLTQQQKSAYYTQIEYQRCRGDVIELLSKTEGIEKRARELEAEVAKLTEELATLRGKADAKPAN
jgi:hypothetical protein